MTNTKGGVMMTKGTYYKRRDAGLCVECGCPLPPMWKRVKCSACYKLKQSHPRPNESEKVLTVTNATLDEMAKEAHRRGISYGQLQTEETIDRIRYADKTNMTLKRWGRQVMFG